MDHELRPTTVLNALRQGLPTLWAGRRAGGRARVQVATPAEVAEAAARLRRFAPVLEALFPELQASGGRIESPLLAAPRMQQALGLPDGVGALWVKADHSLPVAGSVKARGGIHEVLEHVERVAVRSGWLSQGPDGVEGDYLGLLAPGVRERLAQYRVAVGSTGNLGLAIGVMASALGFRAEVHMSADAKAWKKERLRRRGVTVVEHEGDYAEAVAAGRRGMAGDPLAYFVDDEQSRSLLLGYATAAFHLAHQLEQAGRAVDAQHPLLVYVPCGVGGAPAGIALGLEQVFGPHVHVFFAEPLQSPCFMLQMMADSGVYPELGPHPSVYDLGLNNRTEADGLAVPRASLLAADAVRHSLAGVFTVADDTLFRDLFVLQSSEGWRIEPSAAAGFGGPQAVLQTDEGRGYLQRQGLEPHLSRATHVVWTTGGLLVPDEEYERFWQRGRALAERTG